MNSKKATIAFGGAVGRHKGLACFVSKNLYLPAAEKDPLSLFVNPWSLRSTTYIVHTCGKKEWPKTIVGRGRPKRQRLLKLDKFSRAAEQSFISAPLNNLKCKATLKLGAGRKRTARRPPGKKEETWGWGRPYPNGEWKKKSPFFPSLFPSWSG